MFRAFLVLAAAVFVAAPAVAGQYDGGTVAGPYGYLERPLPSSFYHELYRLTPREYRRLRASGFSRDEVFMIANAASVTGLDPSIFANAVYQGSYARQIAARFGIAPNDITRVRDEWKTPEWAAATSEPIYNQDKLDVWW